MSEPLYVYVVTHPYGDGYHLNGVTLVRAYFSEDAAERFVMSHPDSGYQVESVELAAQLID